MSLHVRSPKKKMKIPKTLIEIMKTDRTKSKNAIVIGIGDAEKTVRGAVTETVTVRGTVTVSGIVTVSVTGIGIVTGVVIMTGTVIVTGAVIVSVIVTVTVTGVATGSVIGRKTVVVTKTAIEIGTEIVKNLKTKRGDETMTRVIEAKKEIEKRTRRVAKKKKGEQTFLILRRWLINKTPTGRKKISPGPVAGECSAYLRVG